MPTPVTKLFYHFFARLFCIPTPLLPGKQAGGVRDRRMARRFKWNDRRHLRCGRQCLPVESRQRDQRSSLEYQHGRCSAHGAWFQSKQNYDVSNLDCDVVY